MFYHQTDFDFSNASKKLLLNYFTKKFDVFFDHAEDVDEEHSYKKWLWCQTSVGKELETYLKKYNCYIDFFGITFFICNTKEYYIGNPHIDSIPDSIHKNSEAYSHHPNSAVVSRFSVMVLGNPKDPMYWWDFMPFGDPRLVINEFKYLNNERYFSLNIPGSNTKERWDYLGKPTFQANNIWSPSAFIKTDCAHTVNCSPGPRLMVTVPLRKTIAEIINK
jgi:hypothetical protein